jgi:hypothetical protein
MLRTMARTAVVAGTATSVSNRVSRRQANRWAEQEPPAAAPPPQQYAPPPPPPTSGNGDPDPIEELKKYAALRDQGILTEEEFAAQKAKLLA